MPRAFLTPGLLRVVPPPVTALLLMAGLSSCRNADDAVAPGSGNGATPQYSNAEGVVPDRYIVTFHPGVADPSALGRALAGAHRGEVEYVYTQALQGVALRVPAEALDGLRRNPNVKSIEPDQYIAAESIQPSATWGLDRIDQPALPLSSTYTYDTDAQGVTVYVFDSGIRYDHAEFEGRASFGFDAFGGDGSDCYGHGTHVAGTIGGKTWGVAKKVDLVSVRVFDCAGAGRASGLIAGIDWVIKNNRSAAVANLSVSGVKYDPTNTAVTNMINAGIQAAVAAGNDAADACTKSPASAAAAVTVGATTSADARASYSNFGSCVDVFAPGSSITSASNVSSTASRVASGTSMAAPHAAGVLALLRAQRPDLTAKQLGDWMLELSARNVVAGANSTNAHLLQSLTGGNTGPVAPPPVEPPPTEPPPPVTPTAPAPPANLKAGLLAKVKVKVQWSDQSTNESGFTVERRVGTGEWAKIATVGANVTSMTDGATVKGQSYAYRAFAYNNVGPSPLSNEAAITVGSTTTSKK